LRGKKLRDYSGQWTGWNLGTNEGAVIIDLDRLERDVTGHFYLYEKAGDVAGTVGEIKFSNGSLPESVVVQVRPFHGLLGRELSQDEFHQEFQGFEFPSFTKIGFSQIGRNISATWESTIGTAGTVVLTRGNEREASLVAPEPNVSDWDSFKKRVKEWEHEEFVFRGQPGTWPLRTAFHRTSRSDLIPFVHRDIPKLYNHLSGQLKHLYNLRDPVMTASLWGLTQHHGYPTPLLDWTYSPFVAAYFAYQGVSPDQKTGSVRIFILKRGRWDQGTEVFYVTHSRPLVCLLEPFSLENNRALPQQSIMMVSNVDDIESYIEAQDRLHGDQSLWAIDLPISERLKVLSELRLMGISAGSLFPGIDGTCRDFKERYFPEF
tara:strand:- start:1114 stop:2241 length:1128 start_codon:yes stop_codon:yes gene_type:complete